MPLYNFQNDMNCFCPSMFLSTSSLISCLSMLKSKAGCAALRHFVLYKHENRASHSARRKQIKRKISPQWWWYRHSKYHKGKVSKDKHDEVLDILKVLAWKSWIWWVEREGIVTASSLIVLEDKASVVEPQIKKASDIFFGAITKLIKTKNEEFVLFSPN